MVTFFIERKFEFIPKLFLQFTKQKRVYHTETIPFKIGLCFKNKKRDEN
jgi:hypothetical protein